MAGTEQWSKTTVERKCEPLRSEAIATIEHQETIIARMKAIAARVGEQPLDAADVSEFQALMAESAAFQRHLFALKSEIQMWWLRETESRAITRRKQ
jgi:hypothetical protein